MKGYLLLYDSDCGPCTRFKKAIDFLDIHGNLDFMSIDQGEEIGLLDSLPDPVRHRSFHLILPDKRLQSGAEALPTLIRLLPAGRLVSKTIVSAPKGLSFLKFLYSTVARLHEVGSCKMKSVDHDVQFLRKDPDGRDELELNRAASHLQVTFSP